MLINKDELIKKLQSGEIPDLDALNGVLRDMIKEVVETAMGVELTDFLGYEKNKSPEEDDGNRRNGYSKKDVTSKLGSIELAVPRDRKAEFSPAIIKKRQRHLDGFEDLILTMYSKGMTTRDIQGHIKEIYNFGGCYPNNSLIFSLCPFTWKLANKDMVKSTICLDLETQIDFLRNLANQ